MTAITYKVEGHSGITVSAGRATATKFEPGKTYSTRSISDYDTIFSVQILKRTAKTVTTDRGVCRISEWNGVEQIKPWGNYSMCPVISAK
jgi:hypothetical protein